MNGFPQDLDRQERLMAMGQMAASLAHEIRNPLGSMELFCSLLKKDLEQQPNLLKLAEQIHSGIRTLDKIISNCLQFSRDIRPQRRVVKDVQELLEEALHFTRSKAEAMTVDVALECEGDGPLQIDPYLIKQVIANLTMNAVEAIEGARDKLPQSEQFYVLVGSDLRDADNWTIVVSDNGPGIQAELQDTVFDPFVSTKAEGTGLGLAIVHSIINAHGGKISLSDNAGRGTRITVTLPRCPINEGESH
jgi:signal transduction histidine kinase